MSDITNVLRRRWLASALAAVLVLGAVGLVFQRTSPAYTYTSTVLLLPPEISRVTDPATPDYTKSNPLFFLGSLTQTRDILVGVMTATELAEEVADRFPGVSYTATPDALSSGPVVVLTSTGADEQAAGEAIVVLTEGVPEQLKEIQKGLDIKSDARITSYTLTMQKTPTVSHKDRIRLALVVGGALGLILLFAIGVLDTLLMTRVRRNADKQRQGSDHEVDQAPGRRRSDSAEEDFSRTASHDGAPAPDTLPESASEAAPGASADGHAGLGR